MGAYSDYSSLYLDLGLSVIPCENLIKKPPFNDWQTFCDRLPTKEEAARWEVEYRDLNRITLCMGKASKIVAFDFDYEWTEANANKITIPREDFELDKKQIEREILSLLPPSQCVKRGLRGWTRFYRWDESHINLDGNRNGIRLFDFLAWHRHCIIPPSIHTVTDDGVVKYKWLGTPLEDCYDDLPEISMDCIQEIKYILGSNGSKIDETRHSRIFFFASNICQFEKDKNKIIDQMIKKDLEVNSPPYLSDKKHHKNGDSRANAEKWLDRIMKYTQVKLKLNKGKKVADKNSWDYFFETQLHDIRKDVLTEKIFVKRTEKDKWKPFEVFEGYLRSYAKTVGMTKADVNDEMARYLIEKEKSEFLVDIPDWDGVDYLRAVTDAISSDYFSSDEIYQILHDWGVGVFKRLYSEGRYQNRCIILKGDQGIGKDNFITSLVDGFSSHYYGHPMITRNIKDIIESVMQLMVVHMSEFDQTASISTSQLKDLITAPSTIFREAYGHAATRKQMCSSWISSVNVEDFFRDSTGNRRFIVIPVSGIDWDYPKNLSANIIGQWFAAYKEDKRLMGAAIEEKIKAYNGTLTPESTESLIIESYEARADQKTKEFGFNGYWLNKDVEMMISDIAKCYHMSVKKVRTILKTAGFQEIKKVAGHTHRVFLPVSIKKLPNNNVVTEKKYAPVANYADGL